MIERGLDQLLLSGSPYSEHCEKSKEIVVCVLFYITQDKRMHHQSGFHTVRSCLSYLGMFNYLYPQERTTLARLLPWIPSSHLIQLDWAPKSEHSWKQSREQTRPPKMVEARLIISDTVLRWSRKLLLRSLYLWGQNSQLGMMSHSSWQCYSYKVYMAG